MRRYIHFLFLIVLKSLIFHNDLSAQDIGETTIDLSSKVLVSATTGSSIPATLEDVEWLTGSWVGSREPGHTVEHIILDKRISHMPGFVRSYYDDSVFFYEISVFAEVGNSVSYRVKHFGYDLVGWEKQDEVIDRPLLAKSKNALQFDGITFERSSDDSFTVYFRIPSGPNEGDVLVIPFKRQTSLID